VLASVPDDRKDYRPHEKSYTAAELTWHIAEAETLLLRAVADGNFDNFGAERDTAPATVAGIVEYYEANFAKQVERIKQLTGEQLAAPTPFFGILNQPLVSYLSFVSNHSIHHRGQLSTYLRPMGSTVPSIYGPSGDEKPQSSGASA
jgi:uncharacterized damage-inducible protein DinB